MGHDAARYKTDVRIIRMGLLDKLFGKREKEKGPAGLPEHAVIVHFQYGSTDLSRLFALEEQLQEAIGAAAVGEF